MRAKIIVAVGSFLIVGAVSISLAASSTAPQIASVTASPSLIKQGETTTVKIRLRAPAGAEGVKLSLSATTLSSAVLSSTTNTAPADPLPGVTLLMPDSVVVQPGHDTVSFNIELVEIEPKRATLTVMTVVGGNRKTGSVTLRK
ncbi:MAG: hypothetical protein WD768_03295 [Phycisphaeraceae bacterium]